MKKLYIDYNPSCVRVALTENGELLEFSVEHAAMRGLVGNIYKGRVENVLGGMKAAFVNIGLERNGFLYTGESLVDSDRLKTSREPAAVNLSPGDVIMCQVVKDEFGMKGARLTTDVTLPGNYLVLLPRSRFFGVSRKIEDEARRTYLEEYVKSLAPADMGFIIRSAAERALDEDIESEARALAELWQRVEKDYAAASPKSLVFKEAQLLERAIRDTMHEDVSSIVVSEERLAEYLSGIKGTADIEVYTGDENIFGRFGIAEQIDKLCRRKVVMENGAYIIIDKTEALTVIDVNTGRFIGVKDLEDTVFRTNLAAAECIARQLRVRNISGIVIIDFIDMKSEEHRKEVLERLRAELKKDRMKTTVVSMTELGLVELTRKRTRLPADNFLLQPCPGCMGGYVVSDEHCAFMLRDGLISYTKDNEFGTLIVRVPSPVFRAVFELRLFSRELRTIWRGKRIYFIADDSLPRGRYNVEGTFEKVLTLPRDARLLT